VSDVSVGAGGVEVSEKPNVLLPGEAERLVEATERLVVEHNITVPKLLRVMQYAAELADYGIGLQHLRLAVDEWWWRASGEKRAGGPIR